MFTYITIVNKVLDEKEDWRFLEILIETIIAVCLFSSAIFGADELKCYRLKVKRSQMADTVGI